MGQPLIQISGLRKTYLMGHSAVHALDGLDLSVDPQSFLVVMGPSGSGKSTLLHLVGGLDRPTGGHLAVEGRSLEAMDENALARYRQRFVGFIFQSFNLITSMSALENVEFPLRFTRIPRRQRQARALELLTRVGLADRAYHRPSELSGGELQRVAIARALVNNPQLILADEPTGNLDTNSGTSIMQMLADLHSAGQTVLVVTHDPRMASFATDIIHLLDGKVISNDNGRTPAFQAPAPSED